ncbi:hypothetical protein Vadar_027418 [Vaccinium darrowii]|uniref:Uncharacterized protein n=1 Tax=Vaccinium darrowii TaxID=229202 RepID=A0ACB7YZ45_9ERIC|nr:hypothetical protein Vadar_027418 [Vaccinium darrowii]
MNMLNGPIPYKIGDISRLLFLSLSKNHLNGSIPYQIGNLVTLQILLDLSYNSLTGQISPQLGKLISLEALNLSHNSLSGSILDSFGQMVSLLTIDLSLNQLEGPLPDSRVFNICSPEAFSHNKNLCGDPAQGSVFLLVLLFVVIAFHRRSNRGSQREDVVKRENIFLIHNFCGRLVYGDIIRATDDFDDAYCIGEGGLAKVYKVKLTRGPLTSVVFWDMFSVINIFYCLNPHQVVAVKKLFRHEGLETGDIKNFANEIATDRNKAPEHSETLWVLLP